MADKQFTLCYRFGRFLRCRARQFKAKISLCIRTAKRLYFFNRMRGTWFLRRCNNYCTFAALVIRGLIIASRCKDKFGSLLIIGVVAQIGLQVVLNILVVTDTLPNTGFAFPFSPTVARQFLCSCLK